MLRLNESELVKMSSTGVFQLLASHLKLDRDRGVQELEKQLANAEERVKNDLGDQLICVLEDGGQPWESRHGALMGSRCLIPHLTLGTTTADLFFHKIKSLCLKLLGDGEVRVRLSAGDVLGTLCKHCGPQIYLECKDVVLELIRDNLERQILEPSAADMEQEEVEKLMEKFSSSPERRMSAEEIFHDTAGWKCLETSMKALQAMVEGCGNDFLPFINQELLDMIFQSLTHTNRFVRETAFYVCSSLVTCGSRHEQVQGSDCNPLFEYGHQFSTFLGKGMSDNWSQVRLAASIATRQFLLSFSNEEDREVFYPELLPKMCLNRYYLADGVRLYSQETWRLVADTHGRNLVQKYIKDVVEFYILQTGADNHAVREASCSCIAELAAKLQRDSVEPFVPRLLQTLLVCFQDDSWPVRDAACLACGNFVVCFPDECRSSLDALFPLFFTNLEDNITSVRQGAAAALANVVKAYGEDALNVVMKKLEEGLKAVEKQPSESEKYGNLDKGPATFGVVKRLRDNDVELHTNQTMYSCGSLAPKMGRGRLGGCLDRTFRRPSQPWEVTDGCVYLLAELSLVPLASQRVVSCLPLLADAALKRHYTHHMIMTETICKQLPVIAKGVGKRAFKMHLEAFIEPMFYGLTCKNALASSAASQCWILLSQFLGPNILRGRVEQHDPSLLKQFDENLGMAIV